MPDKPLNMSISFFVGNEVPEPTSGRDIEVVSGVVYRPRTDTVLLTLPHATLHISPGKRFAEALARTMTEAVERETRTAEYLAEDDDIRPCDRCGEKVREIVLNTGEEAVIEPVPSAGGVYIRLGDGIGRLLAPFETPTMSVYAKHRCKRS